MELRDILLILVALVLAVVFFYVFIWLLPVIILCNSFVTFLRDITYTFFHDFSKPVGC